MNPKISIVMGSDSDWKVMKAAEEILLEFGTAFIKEVVSAHRTPEDLPLYIDRVQKKSVNVIIAAAGGAAHLPGMLASYTTLPVIGVPISTKTLNGIDSLLSIVQMPRGIPVATVAIDNAQNAALLALRILAINDVELRKKLTQYHEKMKLESRQKTDNLI